MAFLTSLFKKKRRKSNELKSIISLPSVASPEAEQYYVPPGFGSIDIKAPPYH